MMMLQPGYLPWIGFFEQVYRTDILVLYDDTQFTKLDWRNRNRLKSVNGQAVYITVPVEKAATETLIKDIKISYEQDWAARHLNLMRSYYQKAPYFNDYFGPIEEIVSKKHGFLFDLDMELMAALFEMLGLKRKILISSKDLTTPVEGKGRMLSACVELGVALCYNGQAGRKLYDPEDFLRHGVRLEFQDFRCPVYPQLWGQFVPNLSVVDLLFNCGPDSLSYIIQGGEADIIK